MPKVAMFNIEGSEVGQIELSDAVFGQEVNKSVLHQVVVNYLANQRQGTQSTLTRSEVRGGGIKPWRQKGTGRARQGSIRSPQWTGGGVALGPKPRSYNYRLNKKVKRLAMKSAFSSKVAESELIVLDEMNFDEFKTKQAVNMLNNLKVTEKVLIVVPEKDDNVYYSVRNIPTAKVSYVNTLNVYDILKYDKLILTKDAVSKIEEVYA